MNKKILKIGIILIAVLIILIAFLIPFSMDMLGIPVSKTDENVPIIIAENTSALKVGKTLENNGLVRSRYAFFFKSKFGEFSSIKPGSYTLNKKMTLNQILLELTKERVERASVSVTFPEGYTLEQMAALLEEKGVVTEDSFLTALTEDYDFEFIEHIPKGSYNYALQGFLFPSTYEFYIDSDPREVIGRMLAMFNETYLKNADSYDNVYEIITKASMVEKEAKLESERETIAGVFENRLEAEMPLQIDASVLYAATEGKFDESESSFIADAIANLDSPYNTYKYAGLPEGPICNPGLTSIQAALNPEQHNYYYYHTDNSKEDGSHIFTESYSQHLQTMN